jgi:hypothetical protein
MMSTTDLPRADDGPQIVLGLVGAPGVAFSLARDLADAGLGEELERRLPGAQWRIEVVESRLVPPPATDAAIVEAARRLLLDSGWDVVVCLTDLPLHIHRRLVAHANPVHNVAIVSVPALGAMGARHRIREGIVRLVERLIGSRERGPDAQGVVAPPRRLSVQRVRELGTDTANGAFAFTARVLTGNLVLLGGMVATNQPWRLSLRLSRALTGAVAVGDFGLVYSDVWRLSDAFGWQRLVGTTLLSVGATAATLIVGAALGTHRRAWSAQAGAVVQHRDHGDGRHRRDRALCGAVSAGAGCDVLVCGAASFHQRRRPPGLPPGLLPTSLVDLLFGDDRGRVGCGPGN